MHKIVQFQQVGSERQFKTVLFSIWQSLTLEINNDGHKNIAF